MKIVFFLVLLICFFILQTVFLPHFQAYCVKLDLFFIFVFLVSIRLRQVPAFFLSMASGLLKDMAGVHGFGIHLLLFPVWSFLLVNLSKRIVLEHLLFASIAMFVATFLNAAMVGLSVRLSGTLISWPVFLRICALESLYTALLLPFIMILINAVYPKIPSRASLIEEESL